MSRWSVDLWFEGPVGSVRHDVVAVGSRDLTRATEWANEHENNPLPNHLHVDWSIAVDSIKVVAMAATITVVDGWTLLLGLDGSLRTKLAGRRLSTSASPAWLPIVTNCWDGCPSFRGEAATGGRTLRRLLAAPRRPGRRTCADRGRCVSRALSLPRRDRGRDSQHGASIWPEHTERRHRLDLAATIVAHDPPRIDQGDLRDATLNLIEDAPRDAIKVVFHSAVWLSNEGPSVVAGIESADATSVQPPGNAQFHLGRGGTELIAVTDPHRRWLRWTHPRISTCGAE